MKLEELSIADIKAIYDYARGMAISIEFTTYKEIDYWVDVRQSAKILLEARIKALDL